MSLPVPTEEPLEEEYYGTALGIDSDDDDNYGYDRDGEHSDGNDNRNRVGMLPRLEDNGNGSHGRHHDDDDDESMGLMVRKREGFSAMNIDYSDPPRYRRRRRRGGGNNDNDHEEEDDEEEKMCSGAAGGFRNLILTMIIVLILAILAVMMPGIRDKSKTLQGFRSPTRLPVEYQCPKILLLPPKTNKENVDGVGDGGGSSSSSSSSSNGNSVTTSSSSSVHPLAEQYFQSISTNATEFLETFRHSNFFNDVDGGKKKKTYEEVKEGMKQFKSKYFSPYLQDGSTIYESGCGIGLNLFMTLEILQEQEDDDDEKVKRIENLFVYGNDGWDINVQTANAIYNQIPPALSRRGLICTIDSIQLGFIPENSFDLVYTGRIYPLFDPLQFNLGTTMMNSDRYKELCQRSSHTGGSSSDEQSEDWTAITLNEISQSRQNEWYGHWVTEMARIAKPGVPIIVEHVSVSYCDLGETDDDDEEGGVSSAGAGGVRKEWWSETATLNTFGWDIDPTSVIIEDDTIFQGRYHVFMLKNGKREKYLL